MSLLISLNTDSDLPVDDALHTEHLINLISAKRNDPTFFNAQQDCHELIVILLGLINEIAESTRALSQTLACHADDFGGELYLLREQSVLRQDEHNAEMQNLRLVYAAMLQVFFRSDSQHQARRRLHR